MPFSTIWNIEKIKSGFEKFYKEYGRYPTAFDIDKYSYLPSSRQIQRKFGGLPYLRRLLGLEELDYTKGNLRREIYKESGNIAFKAERSLEEILIKKFQEPFVHIEKPVNKDSRLRYDFFIYAKNNFAVDVFYAKNRYSITGSLNIKINSYINKDPKIILYLVLANNTITQDLLDQLVSNKSKPFPPNTYLLTLENFLKIVEKIKPLKIS